MADLDQPRPVSRADARLQYAHLLTVIGHDDTAQVHVDVRYAHTRAGLEILTGAGDRLHLAAFDVLHVLAYRYGSERAMVPDPGEPPADDRDILAAYECPAGRLCGCRHQHEPSGRGRWPRCPRCGCGCPLPDPDDALDDPDACPCCHYHLGGDSGPGAVPS